MKKDKRTRLERAGWKVGTVRDLLGLSKAEEALVELKLILSRGLRERRARHRITQAQLARLLKSSQSRVAKMEAGDPSVSIGLLIRSLLAMGTTQRELAQVIRSVAPDLVVFQEATDTRVISRLAGETDLHIWSARPEHSIGYISRISSTCLAALSTIA